MKSSYYGVVIFYPVHIFTWCIDKELSNALYESQGPKSDLYTTFGTNFSVTVTDGKRFHSPKCLQLIYSNLSSYKSIAFIIVWNITFACEFRVTQWTGTFSFLRQWRGENKYKYLVNSANQDIIQYGITMYK